MTNPLITIAIPVYNNEKTIKKTINSCLNQDTKIHYEILIVDDASDDSIPEILASYDNPKIRIKTLTERVPLIANHNVCLNNSFGNYVMFCHADDALEPNAIERISKQLEKRDYPKKYVIWGHSLFRDYYLQLTKAGFRTNEIIVGEYASLLPMHGGLTPSGTCYSRESFLEFGGFMNVDIMLAPSDITTMLHLALNGFSFEMIDEMIFIREGASTMKSDTQANTFLEAYDNAYFNFIKVVPEEDIKSLIQLSTNHRTIPFYFYFSLAQDNRFKSAIKKIIHREILIHPWQIKRKIVRKIISRLYSK
ncbi:MAG: glycosyltransferase family 2 protein [Sulfurovum sp.]|nr:glycosyltransferase family 2 protein [Sulfurovaceae bacterium]